MNRLASIKVITMFFLVLISIAVRADEISDKINFLIDKKILY